MSLLLIPHGTLERAPKQDHDRFLFLSYMLTSFLFSLTSRLLYRLGGFFFFLLSFVIVVRNVIIVVLDTTTHHKIFFFFFFFYSLSFFFKDDDDDVDDDGKRKGRKCIFTSPCISGLGRGTHKIRTQKKKEKGRRERII